MENDKDPVQRAADFINDDAGKAERDKMAAMGELSDKIVEALQTIFDPEIPVNIYDLGLIYEINIEDDGKVVLDMTLTSPNCPVAESLPADVEQKTRSVEGVNDCEVRITWEPPWHPSMMTEEAQLELGLIY